MNNFLPKVISPKDDLDAELVLEFLTHYHALEQALVRAGFTRAGRRPGTTRPDWEQFIRHIEGKFDPESSPELTGAFWYLLGEPEIEELRRERLQGFYPGELSSPASDLFWLSALIQEMRDRLLHRINSVQVPVCDETSVMAALYIMQAWSVLDPQVESLLRYGQ